MASTAFAWWWRNDVDERIASDPEYTDVLHRMLLRLNQPQDRGAALDDVVSQPWSRDRRDWYDVAAQLEVGQWLQVGWYVAMLIPVGAEPGRDKDVVGNQRKLDRLSAPFSAACGSGFGDNDGRSSGVM
jgi:hypothetical protein